ncbi:MAG: AAA family ATPase, partial [Candidatus Neomarinimicrobiota bacterium]|nr:AAA family ATPase [Candidatus Neomarinimicrobiota bacterium]
MIKRLFIKDFAIINELELSIKDGLTIITGETGAGKSIILKSLG